MKEFKFHKNIEGLALSQSPLIDKRFNLLDEPELIIEIGTWKGGMAVFLRSVFPNSEIHTFDIAKRRTQATKNKAFKKHKIKAYIENCFDSEKFKKLVASDKKKILLCDGGNKINEFSHFAPMLNKGDIIMMHDFAPNLKYFKDKIEWKFWNTSFESDEVRINNLINRIVKRHKHFDKFLDVVWGVYERI